jgi:hypothetical protein
MDDCLILDDIINIILNLAVMKINTYIQNENSMICETDQIQERIYYSCTHNARVSIVW